MKIPIASSEPTEARNPTTPDGRIASAEVLIASNSTMALVAVPGFELSLSSSSIALIPNGVAALPSPSMLLEMFRIIALIAGLPTGTEGNRRLSTGPTIRAR